MVHPIIHSLTYRYLVLFFSQCATCSSRRVDCLKCSSIYYQPHLSFVVTYMYFPEVVHTWVNNAALCCYAYKCKKSNIFIPLVGNKKILVGRVVGLDCFPPLMSYYYYQLEGVVKFMLGYFDSISSRVLNFHLRCCRRCYLR